MYVCVCVFLGSGCACPVVFNDATLVCVISAKGRRDIVRSIKYTHACGGAERAELMLKCFKTSKAHADSPLTFKSDALFHFRMV